MREPAAARDQAGAFSRRQARDHGVARSTILRRLRNGSWKELVPDVFVTSGIAVTAETRAWAGHLATAGVVSHRTAGALHRIVDDDRSIHVISPPRRHVRVSGVVEHRVALRPDDLEERHGLPVTTRLRTLVDLLATLHRSDAASLLFRGVQQKWIDERSLREQIHRRRRMDGNVQLRTLADMLGTGAHSVAERELHSVLSEIEGLTVEANVRLRFDREVVIVDVLLRRHRIVIEVDGRRFHSDSDQFARDRRRQNRLVGAGYTILRFIWLDIVERPAYVRRTVEQAIAVSSEAKTLRTGP